MLEQKWMIFFQTLIEAINIINTILDNLKYEVIQMKIDSNTHT